ncbi:hypothetical protein B0A48_18132 [Cryoendolithus antarcticus]|uniref:Exportin-5 C-terminal domain-containing protein n=1 Tax=Cryoendolithus antarcticus TaxID=1507870 RepID=A0A1V8SA13_9PEZI|nr:hypothetical protein B0A48_18132 [Cryoendolithus antarcticus]
MDNSETLSQITQALSATLDPRISNEVRQNALQYLEQIKTDYNAPQYGFSLADDFSQPTAVRYYGLQLLEYAVKYRWGKYDTKQADQLRYWIKCLAGSIRVQDELYIRNKIAQLWVEVAKRCWGDEWMDMDSLLVTLWEKAFEEKGFVNKVFVLYVLETLSEDICNREDTSAGLRLEVLGAALNEIMIPNGLYEEHMSTRGTSAEVRAGKEGWLVRMTTYFATLVKEIHIGSRDANFQDLNLVAIRALNALKPTFAWISLKALQEIRCIDCLFVPFLTSDRSLQSAAVEAMYSLLSRPYSAHFHDNWLALVHEALLPERIDMISNAFRDTSSSVLDGRDEVAYTLQKKMSEHLSVLADAVALHPQLTQDLDMPAFFTLLAGVLSSKSLIVSIPVLHSWTKLLAVQDTAVIDFISQVLATLLEICSARLLNYEALPEDSDDPMVQFLYDDFDTMPERHAFLGNYRRYCITVIETISRQRPLEALEHVLERTKQMLAEGPYSAARGYDRTSHVKTSLQHLEFEAQYTVVSSVLKGLVRWETDVSTLPEDSNLQSRAEQDRARASQLLQQWCSSVFDNPIDDPEVAGHVVVLISTMLRNNDYAADFVLYMIEKLLGMRIPDDTALDIYSEAVKGFETQRVMELQRLGAVYANDLLAVYPSIEAQITGLTEAHASDPRIVWAYRSLLFIIQHRATTVSADVRQERLQATMQPVVAAWQDPALQASFASFESFCKTMGLDQLPDFYQQHRFAVVQGWGAQHLDEAGQATQADIKNRGDLLPLRSTKALLAASTEKMPEGSEEHEIACAIWAPTLPVILPTLLQMIRNAQAYNNASNWSHLPDELQYVVRRTLQDRFWQSGISNETKDEFYARVSGSKTSYEGFASTVRGTLRNVREQAYHILYLMTKFEEQFYGLPEFADPLAHALFDDAEYLSANHLNALVNLTTGLVQRCPPHHRARFLPPLLTRFFTTLDTKITTEWQSIIQVTVQNGGDEENLSEEMRQESVLRQLTFATVSFVAFLIDRSQPHSSRSAGKPNISELVVSDSAILEPLLLFCTHALRVRDTRSSSTICRLFTLMIPSFTADTPPAPQVRDFISTEVLKACISSLNEPYFADMQRDLASLIALIVSLYSPLTSTPSEILASLPEMSAERVAKDVKKICGAANARAQRALVLELLKRVRGVSIYEAGRIEREVGAEKKGKNGVQARFMEVEHNGLAEGREVGLEDVGGLFGDA